MQRKSYDKLIDKVKTEISSVQREIEALPEINLFNFIVLWWQFSIHAKSIRSLRERLEKAKAMVNTTIDTFAKGDNASDSTVVDKQNDAASNNYFSQLLNLLKEIEILSRQLESKDFQQFLTNLPVNKRQAL